MSLAEALRRFATFRVAEPAPARSRALDLALTELRCALACFDLVDRVASAGGHARPDAETRALAFAEWCLARAAERFGHAYTREVDAGVPLPAEEAA